jgi:hypothetical protein
MAMDDTCVMLGHYADLVYVIADPHADNAIGP